MTHRREWRANNASVAAGTAMRSSREGKAVHSPHRTTLNARALKAMCRAMAIIRQAATVPAFLEPIPHPSTPVAAACSGSVVNVRNSSRPLSFEAMK